MTEKALPFDFYAGFANPVDPQSGMTVNLVLVDQWLKDLILKTSKVFEELESFLSYAWHDLETKARSQGATVTRVGLKSSDNNEIFFDGKAVGFQTKREISLNIGGQPLAYFLELQGVSPDLFAAIDQWIRDCEEGSWASIDQWKQTFPPEVKTFWIIDPLTAEAEDAAIAATQRA